MGNPFASIVQTLLDRVGKKIDKGSAVYLIGKHDTIWQIHDIKPVLDPQAPPGVVEVTFIASYTAMVNPQVPIPDVLLVLSKAQQEQIQKAALAIHGAPGSERQQ